MSPSSSVGSCLGYPKKMGEMTFSIEGDRVATSANRRGVEVLRMEGVLGERVAQPPPMLGRPHRNIRSSLGLAVPKVLAFTPREEVVEARHADLDIRIGASERDPIADLRFGAVRSAMLYRVNLGSARIPLPMMSVSPTWYLRQWLLRVH